MSNTHNDTKLVTFYFTERINWTSFKFTRRHKKRHRNQDSSGYYHPVILISLDLIITRLQLREVKEETEYSFDKVVAFIKIL